MTAIGALLASISSLRARLCPQPRNISLELSKSTVSVHLLRCRTAHTSLSLWLEIFRDRSFAVFHCFEYDSMRLRKIIRFTHLHQFFASEPQYVQNTSDFLIFSE